MEVTDLFLSCVVLCIYLNICCTYNYDTFFSFCWCPRKLLVRRNWHPSRRRMEMDVEGREQPNYSGLYV